MSNYAISWLNLKKLCVFKAIRREKAKNSGSLATDKGNLLVHRLVMYLEFVLV